MPGNLDVCLPGWATLQPPAHAGIYHHPRFWQLGCHWALNTECWKHKNSCCTGWKTYQMMSTCISSPPPPPPLPFLCHFLITSLSLILKVLLSASFSCQSELYTAARAKSTPSTYINSATHPIPWDSSKMKLQCHAALWVLYYFRVTKDKMCSWKLYWGASQACITAITAAYFN